MRKALEPVVKAQLGAIKLFSEMRPLKLGVLNQQYLSLAEVYSLENGTPARYRTGLGSGPRTGWIVLRST
jgi:hypothetical protein